MSKLTTKESKVREGLRIWADGCGCCDTCPYKRNSYCLEAIAYDALWLLARQDRQLKLERRMGRMDVLVELCDRLDGVSNWAKDIVQEMMREEEQQ